MKNHVYMWLAHHSLRPKSKIAQSSSVELFVCRVKVKVWLLRRRCGGTTSAPSPAPPPWTPSSPSQSSVVDTLCPSFWIWFTSTTTPRVQMTKNVDPGRIAATLYYTDTYRIRIRPGYASDMFPAESRKNRYILAWIRVSDKFGPDGIWPKVVVSPISPPKFRFETTSTPPSPFFCCFGSKRWHGMMNARQ